MECFIKNPTENQKQDIHANLPGPTQDKNNTKYLV